MTYIQRNCTAVGLYGSLSKSKCVLTILIADSKMLRTNTNMAETKLCCVMLQTRKQSKTAVRYELVDYTDVEARDYLRMQLCTQSPVHISELLSLCSCYGESWRDIGYYRPSDFSPLETNLGLGSQEITGWTYGEIFGNIKCIEYLHCHIRNDTVSDDMIEDGDRAHSSVPDTPQLSGKTEKDIINGEGWRQLITKVGRWERRLDT